MNGNRRGFILSVAMLALLTSSGRTATQDEIDRAVEKGVKYLKSIQITDTGEWKYGESGATSLAALTLLVCDVPNNDPVITKAADFVRAAVPKMTSTYSITMAIVFFDRLGDVADIPLIESLMVRLMAGQSGDGGWGYQCPGLDNAEVQRLTGLIGKRTELKGGRFPRVGERKQPSELQKETQQQIRQLSQGGVGGTTVTTAGSDNSNTQFATLAMWVGRKHGLPVDSSLVKLDGRFRNTQGSNGGWGYITFAGGVAATGFEPNAQMTCAGIMGIAIAHGIANDPKIKRGGQGSDPKADASLKAAVAFLAASVPQGDVKPVRLGHEQGKVYYSMWSMERACMALGLERLGNKDWHQWGADLLLLNQAADGGWHGEHSTSAVGGAYGADTCFALLFLRKANFTGDLSAFLKGKFTSELRGITKLPGVKGITTPAEKQGEDPRGKDKEQPKAKPIESREKTKSEKLSDALVLAKGAERKALLKDYEKGDGRDFTVALALSIPLLDGEDKASARDVLQERLAGLSVKNLEWYTTKEEDPEIKAAALLASARKPKDDRTTLVPLIIDRLGDRDPYVVRAAAFALKFISGQDFGPTETATAKEIEEAMDKWKNWWMRNKG